MAFAIATSVLSGLAEAKSSNHDSAFNSGPQSDLPKESQLRPPIQSRNDLARY